MYVFGGQQSNPPQTYNDLHLYDLRRGEWLEPAVVGDRPAEREGHSMVEIGSTVRARAQFGGMLAQFGARLRRPARAPPLLRCTSSAA